MVCEKTNKGIIWILPDPILQRSWDLVYLRTLEQEQYLISLLLKVQPVAKNENMIKIE